MFETPVGVGESGIDEQRVHGSPAGGYLR